ncbi:MAG: tetratricopeptide repeat protein [bacterium]|jgi:tetratricopeptide (TPR) repeat protein
MFWERAKDPLPRLAVAALAVVLMLTPSCGKKKYEVVVGKEGYTHMVSKGETLDEIAREYYGDARLAKALGDYNGVDPFVGLQPGTTLLVPFDTSELEKIARTHEADVLYNKGTVLAETGQYEDARPYLERAVDADPSNSDAWFNLAVTYTNLGKLEQAGHILEKLIESYPSEAAYHYSLGVAFKEDDRKKDALEEFRRAIDLRPTYAEAQYAVALTLEQLGKKREAIAEWERYLELDSDSVWAEEARVHLDALAAE